MRKILFLSLFVVITLLLATPALGMSEGMPNKRTFVAHLSGDEAGVETLAQGQVIFHLSKDGATLYYKLIVANIENVTMAHIHLKPQGQVVVWLYPAAPPPVLIPGRFDGVLAEGEITAADLVGPLAGMSLSDLIEAIKAGNTYVNVHTTQYPAGEIRGTIH